MAQGNEFHSSGSIAADGSFTSAFSEVYDDEVYPVGTLRYESSDSVSETAGHSGDRLWVFVKAVGALTANTVIKRDTSGTPVAPFSGATAGANAPVATLLGVAQTTIADTKYGWIVKRGVCEVIATSALTKGDHLISTASGKVDDTGLTGGNGSMVLGQALDDGTTDNAFTAYISIP